MVGAPAVVLVASAGGHLTEMEELAPRCVPPGWRRCWLVPGGDQADSLSARGEQVHRLRPTGPRDWRATIANAPTTRRVMADLRPAAVLSTGAAVAVPAFALGRAYGAEVHYLESAARTRGPSLTGRLVGAVPGARLYTQWPEWEGGRWQHPGSVFDGFSAHRRSSPGVRRVVVTLGTQAGYGFRRLVERLAGVVPPSVEVLWQTGATDVSGIRLGERGGGALAVRVRVPPDELAEAMRAADVVVAHAGIGSTLMALRAGRRPLLVPRRSHLGEHVDDHQNLIGAAIASRDLAAFAQADSITWSTLEEVAGWEVDHRPAPELRLGGALGAALGGDQ